MDSILQGTVLFADVRRDTSKLYAAAGATKALEAIRQCLDMLQQAARAGGGQVVKTMGDAFIAVFPAPAAAADAAAAMQTAVDELPALAQTRLGLRIAFHLGPVTLRDGDVLGDTVNLAARLVEQARAEQIVTSADTAAALGRSYKSRVRAMPTEGDAGQTGLCEFIWRVGADTAQIRPVAMSSARQCRLLLKYGATEIANNQGEHRSIKMGRDLESSLIILDPLASRDHCTIEGRGEGFVLIDHSTNGTYITEEGDTEVLLQHGEVRLRKHGWLAFGQPRAKTDHIVEYFCA